ncbi:TIGR03564 family F420-dependent LLM class oxidoreductase [Streptomyces sp. NPDC002088]|uniref:TIGR03564 family F420-dependent LLM class oxidoreductase n=1 Tax=Streptomyces sp. NPDC002088 TaxID=3154665 RepID=UPI003327F922
MRIGLTGGAATTDGIVLQARRAEADGFAALWYASLVAGDPLVAMALAGRATERIELGTAVLQTYPCHPLLQASRVAAAAEAMGRPGLTLGIGPSHRALVEGAFGLSYDHPGRSTEEYTRILTALLRGEDVDFTGADWSVHSAGRSVAGPGRPRVPVLLAALGPRLLRVAGRYTDGAVLWLASAKAIADHVAPRLREAAREAGRPTPRIVAGLPVAVHDEENEARSAVAAGSDAYAGMPNYRRILNAGGAGDAAGAAIVGDERAVREQLTDLIEAGATDVWANVVPVGKDRATRRASARRTRDLLAELAAEA